MSELTLAQQQAVLQGGNVLVVAGAGTGKTRTLVARCIHWLLETGCDLDEILMVTFTEAAAAEMRKRIREELQGLHKTEANPARLKRIEHQLLLLDAAHIGTLHSFCLKVIRRHVDKLGIDPAVKVFDKQQTAPLIAKVFDELFAAHYEDTSNHGEAVRNLLLQYGDGSEAPLRAMVLQLYEHCRSLANAEEWLQDQERCYHEKEPKSWRNSFARAFAEWLDDWRPELQQYARFEGVKLWLAAIHSPGDSFEKTLIALCRLHDVEATPAHWPRGSKTPLEKFRDDLKKLCSTIEPVSAGHALDEQWTCVRAHMLTLLGLTREFTDRYWTAKRAMGGLDFADLEQLALRLLHDQKSGQPTSVASSWRNRLKFIFVDECQDLNRAQDAIIAAISREGAGANRFLVGDVKQSIYRFRRADPSIFVEYEQTWKGAEGSRVHLSDNFRSAERILLFVNALFKQLMRRSVGGIEYTSEIELQFGDAKNRRKLSADYDPGPNVELHLINPAADNRKSTDEGGEAVDLTETEQEAKLAARLLRRLHDSKHMVWHSDGVEPVAWKDMAVLLRSVKGRAETYAREFRRQGIPLVAPRSGFFEAFEVTDLLSVLQILDNPLQDAPLLSVLRSPLAGISLEELAAIRLARKKGLFWEALCEFHATAKDRASHGWVKIDRFLNRYTHWRRTARQISTHETLKIILDDTYYEALLAADGSAPEKVANVQRLLDLARNHDPHGRQGLYRFLKFVEAQQDEEVEHEPASAQTEDAVQLMSIHKSKGLEFPVVLLGGLGTRFNTRDLDRNILISNSHGICPKIWPPGAPRSYSGLAHWMGRRAELRELHGEEMRLLYVAVTRAQDTLLLTGTCRQRAKQNEDAITERHFLKAQSYLAWISSWLARSEPNWTPESSGQNDLLRWQHYSPNDAIFTGMTEAPPSVNNATADIAGKAAVAELKKRIQWEYPWSAATSEPAVKRISEVIWSAASDADEAQRLLPSMVSSSPRRSVGGRRKAEGLNAADVGIAHHLFLQSFALGSCASVSHLHKQAQVLVADGVLIHDEAAVLDLEAIHLFWISDVGRKILREGSSIHREIPFTARLSPEDLARADVCPNAAELAGEYFIVRGVVDLAVILPGEIWILDFKTDRADGASLEAKKTLYGRQLTLYGLALGRIFRRAATHRWLHFLDRRETVNL